MRSIRSFARPAAPFALLVFAGVPQCALRADSAATAPAIRAPASRAGRAFSGHLAPRAPWMLAELREGATPPAGWTPVFARWYRVPVAPERVEMEGVSALVEPGRNANEIVERFESEIVYRLDDPPASMAGEAGAPARATSSEEATQNLVANDPLFPQQWHHHAVGAPGVWDSATGDGVVVAIVDSGVSPGPDLVCAPLAGEYDAVNDLEGTGAGRDLIGHGTFVAGVVAQCTGNGFGGVGLAPGARILAIRACDLHGNCTASDVARGIDWALAHGARVINLSLGMACGTLDWPACSEELQNDAIAAAVDAGVVVVAIAGNGAEDHVGFPANHPRVIGVGGVGATLDRVFYSSFGRALSVMAPAGEPGVDRDHDGHDDQILQETFARICGGGGSGYAFCRWSGTSFAAPHVVAAVALLLERHPGASPEQLREAIEQSALDRGDPGFDPEYGWGVLQAGAALPAMDAIAAADPLPCRDAPGRLCLGGGRFALEIAWRDFAGRTGRGTAVPLSRDSGLFWFFDAANFEVLVKVLDGCALGGHRWVFSAATTNVAYTLTVTDTATGAVRTYENVLGTSSPAITDTAAFACDG